MSTALAIVPAVQRRGAAEGGRLHRQQKDPLHDEQRREAVGGIVDAGKEEEVIGSAVPQPEQSEHAERETKAGRRSVCHRRERQRGERMSGKLRRPYRMVIGVEDVKKFFGRERHSDSGIQPQQHFVRKLKAWRPASTTNDDNQRSRASLNEPRAMFECLKPESKPEAVHMPRQDRKQRYRGHADPARPQISREGVDEAASACFPDMRSASQA